MNVLDVNSINLRNMYPAARGVTTGQSGGANNQTAIPQVAGATSSASDSGDVAKSLSIGGQASPAIGALVFIALIVGLGFAAQRFGTVDEFKNIRVTPFNVLIISLAAVIGIPVWKYAFTKLPVPAVSTWVHSV
jgi:hypothetical protein